VSLKTFAISPPPNHVFVGWSTSRERPSVAGFQVIINPVLGDHRDVTKQRIEHLGPPLMFNIQLPPPTLGAICASAEIHASDELPSMQRELADRLALARRLIRANPMLAQRAPVVAGDPTPVYYIVLGDADDAIDATQRLLARGFLVNPVAYPAVPVKQGGFASRSRAPMVRTIFAGCSRPSPT
jgi:7-keto-8-aminopelargonate synthetase-like enzyme